MDCCRNVEKGQSCGLLSGVCFPPTPDEMVVYVYVPRRTTQRGQLFPYFPVHKQVYMLVYDVYTLLQSFFGPVLGENYTRIQHSYKTVLRAHTGSPNGPATHLCNVVPDASHIVINCVVRIAVVTLSLVCVFSPTDQIVAQDCCSVTVPCSNQGGDVLPHQHFQLCFNNWQISPRSNTTKDTCNRTRCGGIAISSYIKVITASLQPTSGKTYKLMVSMLRL